MKRIFFTIFILHSIVFAQLNEVDSLENILKSQQVSKKEKIEISIRLSDLYLSRNSDRSFIYSRKAITLSEEQGDSQLIGHSYRALGNCYIDKGEHDTAQFYLEFALTLIPKDPLTYFLLGQNEWYNTDDEVLIEKFYEQAEKASVEKNDYKTLAITYYAMADYYRYNQQDSTAKHYIDLSIRILEKSNLKGDLAMAYNIQAEIYRTKGDYRNALETYIKTAQLAYQILDSNRIGYCFSRIGYILYMQNDFVNAENYLLKSLELAAKVKARNLKLFSLKALTDMYSNQGNLEKCKMYALLCLNLSIELQDPTGESLAYSSLSNLYSKVGLKDSAIYYADKAYLVSKKNEDPINTLNAILNKLTLFFESGKYADIIQLADEGIKLAKYTETMEHLRDLYKYKYKAHEALHENAEAFIAYKKYSIYEDSLANTDISIGMYKSKLEMIYQDKHLADTLVYVKKAQESQQKILLAKQRSGFVIIVGSIIAAFLTVILLIIWRTSAKRKRLNISLAESNHEKELLLKEIHHRVKNSLQTVSSLLQLQKNNSDGKDFNHLIDDSQVKINNIAIVHELLYQSSSFRKINLQDYTEKLITHISKTYEDGNQKIEIIKDIPPIEVALEKSVPLALVMNEIITNSYKYAFKGINNGQIEISASKFKNVINISIKDNGIGLPETNLPPKSIGITLIQGFVKQLKGELSYGSNNGCFFVFSFPDID